MLVWAGAVSSRLSPSSCPLRCSLLGCLRLSKPVRSSTTQTFTVADLGAVAADEVNVALQLPAGHELVGDSGGRFDRVRGVRTVGSLRAGQSAILHLEFEVPKGAAGVERVTIAEIATAGQFDVDSAPGNGTETKDERAVLIVVEEVDTTTTSTTPVPPESLLRRGSWVARSRARRSRR